MRALCPSSLLLTFCCFLGLSAAASAVSVPSDFDGDGKTDLAVFHRSAGTPGLAYWKYLSSSSGQTLVSVQWGVSTDTPVPGDYDGDGITDTAIVRPGSGINAEWWILGSTDGQETYIFGYNSDTPVPRDFNGDGETDAAVVRPGTGNSLVYYNDEPNNDYCVDSWGLSGDKPVSADYNGDGQAEIAVFRPSNATWYILTQNCSTTTSTQAIQWGLSTDRPVPGDYDGDGKADLAVFRPGDSTWYIRQSSQSGALLAVTWGLSTDLPVPGDYDGDGKFDVAVFRPSTATWYVLRSSDAQTWTVQFGDSTDTPVPSLYIP